MVLLAFFFLITCWNISIESKFTSLLIWKLKLILDNISLTNCIWFNYTIKKETQKNLIKISLFIKKISRVLDWLKHVPVAMDENKTSLPHFFPAFRKLVTSVFVIFVARKRGRQGGTMLPRLAKTLNLIMSQKSRHRVKKIHLVDVDSRAWEREKERER